MLHLLTQLIFVIDEHEVIRPQIELHADGLADVSDESHLVQRALERSQLTNLFRHNFVAVTLFGQVCNLSVQIFRCEFELVHRFRVHLIASLRREETVRVKHDVLLVVE